ncbi:MAG: transposase [Actinomycetota bacterium]|nr:transposase [Actinomycetota bacterium]
MTIRVYSRGVRLLLIHFLSRCYHPLFVFNQFGDCEGATLRPGNVHSADGWRGLLQPMVERYRAAGKRIYFRGDAASAPRMCTNTSRITTCFMR